MKSRRSIRLREYDYRQGGAYFVTLCVHPTLWRNQVFGHIEADSLTPNPFGHIVLSAWKDLPNHHPTVTLNSFILMPNHVHCLVILGNDASQEWRPGKFASPKPGSLSTVIGSFKSAVTRETGKLRGAKTTVWQRGFYESVVRSEKALNAIRRYIAENPANWHRDELNAAGEQPRAAGGHGRPCPYSGAQWRPELPS